MLDFLGVVENTWMPPSLSADEIDRLCMDHLTSDKSDMDFLAIIKIEPYIDSLYIHNDDRNNPFSMYTKRFTFNEGFRWGDEEERIFVESCLNNDKLYCSYAAIDTIFRIYSEKYPDWKLKRYYTKPMRVLDHIYHCMRRGTAKEILYKAELDNLAANIEEMDEINLLSCKPSDIYGGISMSALRALNCTEGAILLATEYYRNFVKELQMKFPEIFKEKMNDAQCKYLHYLIQGNLTVGEAGRLFAARKQKLMFIWAPSQYDMFIWKEKLSEAAVRQAEEIALIDPIYKDYVGKIDLCDVADTQNKLQTLRYYLLQQREQYDKGFRRSNRKRNQDWQERDKGYVVRFPQTINDFCRESIYMCNCLITYVDAYINNDTTILFMRKTDDFNVPFITIEIFENKLMQAYHRFNEDCTPKEAEWICDYCDRHGIELGKFKFNNDIDELY